MVDKLTGAQLFARTLVELGIGEVFTLVGDHLNEVLGEVQRAGIRIVDMRHESGVTQAADAWARVTRRPALSLVTGGPGHTNSLTGIAMAFLACSPLIAVSGARASTLAGRQSFQDIEQLAMARPVTKWAAELSRAAQIPLLLRRAYTEANSGRRGPVHLSIPVDVFTDTAAPGDATLSGVAAPASPGSREVDRALDLLRAAQRPVVIAGSGTWWSGADAELREFIEKAAIPLYTITLGRGVVSDEHPLCMGYADPSLNRAAAEMFQRADVVFVVGKRIDYRLAFGGARLFSPTARFVQIDVHSQEFGMNRGIDVAICADAREALRALIDGWGKTAHDRTNWLDEVRARRRDWEDRLAASSQDTASPLHPAAFFAELKRVLPRNVLYSWDGGDFVHWGRVMLPAREPGGWLRLGPLGGIGASLPYAIALQMRHPERPVAVITGDGSIGFYIAELDTAVRQKLPLVIIVGNDAGWGLERELQREFNPGEPAIACELRPTRYDIIMKGFGGDGETVERLDQVRPAVERAFAAGVPYCINAIIRGVRSPFTEWQIVSKKMAY